MGHMQVPFSAVMMQLYAFCTMHQFHSLGTPTYATYTGPWVHGMTVEFNTLKAGDTFTNFCIVGSCDVPMYTSRKGYMNYTVGVTGQNSSQSGLRWWKSPIHYYTVACLTCSIFCKPIVLVRILVNKRFYVQRRFTRFPRKVGFLLIEGNQ